MLKRTDSNIACKSTQIRTLKKLIPNLIQSKSNKMLKKLFQYYNESILLKFIQAKDWLAVIERARNHPLEAGSWGSIFIPSSGAEYLNQGINSNQYAIVPVKKQNKDVRDGQHFKFLPLHASLAFGAPLSVIKELVSINPQAIWRRDEKYDRFPLHFACLYDPRFEVVQFLINRYVQAVQHRDTVLRCPLHYAAFGKADASVIELLIEHYPKAARIADSRGWLPLHVAVKMSCSFETLRKLVEAYPESLNSKTVKGSTPLHVAIQWHGSGSIIESQIYALKAAVDAVYDTTKGKLSLAQISSALWQDDPTDPPKSDNEGLVIHGSIKYPCQKENKDSSTCICEDASKENQGFLDQTDACVLCLQSPRTHAFVPCGHLSVCATCASLVRRSLEGVKCPLCRKKAFMIMKVYR